MNDHKHFLKLLDFTPAEIQQFLDTAADLKAKKKAGVPHRYLEGKNVALIFEKTSTRTRCAFEVAAQDLGMGSTYLGPTGSQIGVKESIADTARVLGRMYDGIEYRGFGQAIVEELAQYAGVPVFNGLTDEFHPTQILADFLTIQEHFGKLAGIKLVYLGDARFNMGNSLMVGCAKMGMHFVACAPKAYMPDQKLIDTCQAIAGDRRRAGVHRGPHGGHEGRRRAVHGRVGLHGRAGRGLAGADRRSGPLPGDAGADGQRRAPVPLYALPARLPRPQDQGGPEMGEKFGREAMEVTDEVFESPASIVFDEAENRMHTIKAVMYELMK